MDRFTIRCFDADHACSCPVCGKDSHDPKGPRLFLADGDDPVCRDCGKKVAPNLMALLDLAHVAEKVGRRCRVLLTPPMESLLALARAAENYTQAAPRVPVRAA